MKSGFLLIILLSSTFLHAQIDSKFLIGSWCVDKITNVPSTGQKEVVQSQIMEEYVGIVMLFTTDEYTVYFENSDDDISTTYGYALMKDNRLVFTDPATDEGFEFNVEKISKTQLVFVTDDEEGKNRFYMNRCD